MKPQNGRLPATSLTSIAFAPGTRAQRDAARAVTALSARFGREFKRDIEITGAYRTFDQQVALKNKLGFLAAVPGTSNHGWGVAFDLGGGINVGESKEHEWMQREAKHFGLDNPDWATPGTAGFQKDEPWHWEHVSNARDGSRAVVELQKKLRNAKFLRGVADAYWGVDTERAWKRLMDNIHAKEAAKGRIRWVQTILSRSYAGRLYSDRIDGDWGDHSQAAAVDFHRRFSGVEQS
jgi:hypothetical protein